MAKCTGIFQSTPPARGATASAFFARVHCPISIHAPREGSDRQVQNNLGCYDDFNPRPPRGERRMPFLFAVLCT